MRNFFIVLAMAAIGVTLFGIAAATLAEKDHTVPFTIGQPGESPLAFGAYGGNHLAI